MDFTLGQRIRQLRLERGLTQRQLAEPDLTKGLISLIENGRARPSLKTLQKIADRLGVPLGELLDPARATEKDLRIMVELGEGALSRQDFRVAAQWFEAAAAASGRRGERHLKTVATVGLAEAMIGLDAFDEAERLLADASAPGVQDDRLHVRIRIAMANIHLLRGKLRLALEEIHRAVALVDNLPAPDPWLKARALLLRGTISARLGKTDDALVSYHQVTEIAGNTDLIALGDAYRGLSMTYREEGELDLALGYARMARECFERAEDLFRLMYASRNLGILLLERQDPSSARSYLEHSLRLAEDLKQDLSRGKSLTELARCALAEGRLDEAKRLAEDALATVAVLDDPAERGRVLLVLAEAALAFGDREEALRHAEEALRIFSRSGFLRESVEAEGLAGELLLEKGDTAAAARHLLEAYRGAMALAAVRRLADRLSPERFPGAEP